MERMHQYQIKARVRLFRKEEPSFGPGIARLMEEIKKEGSLAKACRSMKMAYSKGWKIVKRAEEDLGFSLMEGAKGGRDGGSTTLTAEGERLLHQFRAFEQDLEKEMKRLQRLHFPEV